MHNIIKINMSNNDPASQVSSICTPLNANCQKGTIKTTTSVSSNGPAENSGSGSQFTLLPNYLSSLTERIGQLCETKIFSDVKFEVGEGKDIQEFCGHKLILAIASPVFSAMFYGGLQSEDCVAIPDCKPYAFQKLLEFAYKNELLVSDAQLALDVLYAARKYSMRLLEEECMAYLRCNITFESVLAVKEAAEKYQLPSLESACTVYIEDHALDVLKHHHPYLNTDTIIQFVKNDKLNINEIDLFRILSDWASQECERLYIEVNAKNKREMLEPCIYHIRFPIMEASDFADYVVPTGILTTVEIANILTYISTTDKNQLPDCGFSSLKRSLKSLPDPQSNKSNQSLTPLAGFSTPQSSTTTDRTPRGYHRSRKRSRNH